MMWSPLESVYPNAHPTVFSGDYSQSLTTPTSPSNFLSAFGGVANGNPLKMDATNSAQSELKCVQQHQLASFMSNLQQFQSANPTKLFYPNTYDSGQRLESSSSPPNVRTVKKRSNPVPDKDKTPAYFERRKKNNDSARRSREMRRLKEEENQRRNTLLEQKVKHLQAENYRIHQELFILRNAYNKLFYHHHHQSAAQPSPLNNGVAPVSSTQSQAADASYQSAVQRMAVQYAQ